MTFLQALRDSLIIEFIIVVVGSLAAYSMRSLWLSRRYQGYTVRIIHNGREILRRPISPEKARQIATEPADLSVFLKGVVSPFAHIHYDLLTEGQSRGLLTINPSAREYLINLDHNSPPPKTPDGPLTLLNFSHPLTAHHQQQIETAVAQPLASIHNIPAQFDHHTSFPHQIRQLLQTVPLTPHAWQTTPLLINPPAYAPAASTLLAELHGRLGYFPAIIRLKPVPDTTPPQFELAELINLQTVRADARQQR